MGPTTAQLSSQMRQMIYNQLDNGSCDNALFLAGRLHGIEPRNPDAVHLLGLCYLRLGDDKSAYGYSRQLAVRGSHLGCSFVFAQACLRLQRQMDGISALERARSIWEAKQYPTKITESSRRFLPDAAAVNCLLGKLLHANGDIKKAIECYVAALKLNPFMWDAYERLCDTGASIRPSNIFRATAEVTAYMASFSHPPDCPQLDESQMPGGPLQAQPTNNVQNIVTPGTDPFHSSKAVGEHKFGMAASSFLSKLNNGFNSSTPNTLAGLDTPTTTSQVHEHAASTAQPQQFEAPHAPLRKQRSAHGEGEDSQRLRIVHEKRAKDASNHGGGLEVVHLSIPTQHKRTFSGSASHAAARAEAAAAPQARRSARLIKWGGAGGRSAGAETSANSREVREMKKARLPGSKTIRPPNTSTVGRVVSGNRKPMEGSEHGLKETRLPNSVLESLAVKAPLLEDHRDPEITQWLLDLFSKLGHAYYALSRFQGQLALQTLQSLPPAQRDTPWVLAHVGKAYYEQNKYAEAEKAFARLRKMVPSRLKDMEIYSTVLYHLKLDTELAFLSHELIEIDRLSPEAWCTIGNSFSLQRDHDQALKCFRRSTQLDPSFAYGYTLQGHEHMENEEYDKAQLAYRRAIGADHRHYNGWYGLGKVYEKLGKYEMAEKHYRFAASINPTNSILVCCIGVVLEKLKKPQAALVKYSYACELAPHSPIALFKKARVLLNLGRPREALEQFEILKDMVPDESNVHFMLGRVYKILRDKANAIRHFTIALNLDPKAAQYIKEAMEALDDDDDMGDDDAVMS